VTTTFEEGPERNRAFGVYAAVSGAGAALGLILGGLLTDYLSWRWVLFVNAPIGLALALVTPLVLVESGRGEGRFALADAVTSTLGIGALVYGFIHAANKGWTDPVTVSSFAAAVVLLAVFLAIEARSAQPLMPLRLFRNRNRVGAYVVMIITGAAVLSMFYFLTQFVQDVLRFSPIKAGLAFLPVSAVIIVVAQVASRLMTRVEPKLLIGGGTLFAGFGLYSLTRLTVHSSYAGHVLPALALIAVGMGSIFVPITIAAVADVRRDDTGIASAMLNVGQQIGGTLGLASLVTVFSHAAQSYADAHRPGPGFAQRLFTHGAATAFLAATFFMAAGFVAAILLVKVDPPSPDEVAGVPGH
jgi:predicted MFS family arabinose efflux permease